VEKGRKAKTERSLGFSIEEDGNSTFVERKGQTAKTEKRTFTRRQHQKVGGTFVEKISVNQKQNVHSTAAAPEGYGSTFVEKKIRQPNQKTFTRRQHQKNDSYERANEFDFPDTVAA
jgi:hypothetical protein